VKAIDKVREIAAVLKEKKLDYPEKLSQDLVCKILKIDRVKLYTENPDINEESLESINSMVNRLLLNEPFQYILGEVDFYNIKVRVGEGVLIPRPETEILVDEVIKRKEYIMKIGRNILDICTGSGCIAIALAKNIPDCKVYASDISEKAIFYAKENKILNSVDNVYFVSGDLFKPFKLDSFACITANPPYISKDEINSLPPNIRKYEPGIALNGGKEGLQFYKRIIKEVKKYILKNGLIFLELGINQAKYVCNMAENEGLDIVDAVKDLAGIERVMILKRG